MCCQVSWFDNGKSYERYYTPSGDSTLTLHAYMRMFGEAAQEIENEMMDKHTHFLENQLRNDNQNNADMTSLSRAVLLDSSPGNYDLENMAKIAHLLPDSKLVFIMRDPVEREFSRYRFHYQLQSRKRFNEKNQNAEGFHRYVTQRLNATDHPWPTSLYSEYVEMALQLFKRENLLFIQFETFIEDPMTCLEEKLLPFLGLNEYKLATRKRIVKELKQGDHSNVSKLKYSMFNKTKILLMKYFSQHNRKLADLLGDDMWTWGY